MKSIKKKLTNLLVLISLIGSINVSNAADPIYLNSGDKAPYPGLLFTEEKAQKIRTDLLESDKTKLLLETEKHRSERMSDIIKLKDQEIEQYANQNQRLEKVNNRSDTLNYVWFGLGILATGMAVYGAGALKQ